MVLVGVLVLVLAIVALWRTDLGREAVEDLFRRADPLALVAAMTVITVAMPCMAMRWRSLLPTGAKGRGHPVVLTLALFLGQLFNLALPGPVGDLSSAAIAHRRYEIPLLEALTALLVGRVVGLASACALAAITLLTFPLSIPVGYQRAVWIAAGALAVAAGALLLAAVFPGVPRAMVDEIARRLVGRQGLVAGLLLRGVGFASRVVEALVSTSRRGVWAYVQATTWALCGHLSVATGIAMAAWALGADPAWSGVVFTYAVATAGAVVLFLIPGSQIGWDISFGAILAVTTGISATDAGAVTVLSRFQQVLVMLAGVATLTLFASDLLPDRLPGDEDAEV